MSEKCRNGLEKMELGIYVHLLRTMSMLVKAIRYSVRPFIEDHQWKNPRASLSVIEM